MIQSLLWAGFVFAGLLAFVAFFSSLGELFDKEGTSKRFWVTLFFVPFFCSLSIFCATLAYGGHF